MRPMVVNRRVGRAHRRLNARNLVGTAHPTWDVSPKLDTVVRNDIGYTRVGHHPFALI